MSWEDDYKRKMRRFLEENGSPVQFESRDDDYEYVSPYGWEDYHAIAHCRGSSGYNEHLCRWVVPEGAVVKERSYEEFEGTFVDNKNVVGVNVYGVGCACGKYADVVLRWTGSLADVLTALLDVPKGEMTL